MQKHRQYWARIPNIYREDNSSLKCLRTLAMCFLCIVLWLSITKNSPPREPGIISISKDAYFVFYPHVTQYTVNIVYRAAVAGYPWKVEHLRGVCTCYTVKNNFYSQFSKKNLNTKTISNAISILKKWFLCGYFCKSVQSDISEEDQYKHTCPELMALSFIKN